MDNFEYKVSVIVPVYNVDKYVAGCLDSLINQTISHDLMEVLVINDGSTDNSLNICKEYADTFQFIKLYSKENEGLSATRNYGIRRAKGKYLMYLDSDDKYTPETVKEVTNFFDQVYDEVDLVTFLDQPYKDGKKTKPHSRYNYMKKTGVYDLNEFPYIMQTRVNVCVKNMLERNVLFPTVNKDGSEDQQYNNSIVAQKMKIGFCEKGEYQYNRSNENSIMHARFFPIYIFEGTIKYYESLFGSYENGVPKYFQVMFMHDLSWKLMKNILMPYHLHGEDYNGAFERMRRLMDQVDDDVILNNPTTDNFHRHFFMNWKHNNDQCTVVSENSGVSVYKRKTLVLRHNKFEIILYNIKIINNKMTMLAMVKSPIFNYTEKPNVYVNIMSQSGEKASLAQNISLAGESYYHTKEKTNNFWHFYFEHNINKDFSFDIMVEVDGIKYPTTYWFAPSSPFYKEKNEAVAVFRKHAVWYENCVFRVRGIGEVERKQLIEKRTGELKISPELGYFRKVVSIQNNRRIWLYYDCAGVGRDNGFKQFEHDYDINDGVERFYVNTDVGANYDDKYGGCVVEFGSSKHKLLYLLSEAILTAYVEAENVVPFSKDERAFVCDIAHPIVVYLQHGILHAHLPWKYVPGRVEADKIVVSSNFEINNFTEIYHFRMKDLIPVGMARYDFIDKNIAKTNRILFAPSWRNYLIGGKTGNLWNLTSDRFLKSEYFRNFNEFLNSEELESILERYDYYLDFKIHPIFKPYLEYFDNNNTRVSFSDTSVKEAEYSVFITDFSSFVFDFGYLERAIMYFVPDWEEFTSGMNQYRELDLPFDKAFGPFAKDTSEALRIIDRILADGTNPTNIYQERMKNFYLDFNDCRQKLYEYLSKMMTE